MKKLKVEVTVILGDTPVEVSGLYRDWGGAHAIDIDDVKVGGISVFEIFNNSFRTGDKGSDLVDVCEDLALTYLSENPPSELLETLP